MKKCNEPTPEQMAQDGDVRGLLRLIRDYPRVLRPPERIRLLRLALAAAADNDFDECVGLVYRMMILFTTDLLVVAQTFAARRVEQVAEAADRCHDASARDALDGMLPPIERLHGHLITLTRAHATTTHTRGLGGRRTTARAVADRVGRQRLRTETRGMAEDTARAIEDVAEVMHA